MHKKIIYSLCVEDILTVMEDSDMKIELDEQNIKFIEDRIGDMIDWRGAIEFALLDLSTRRAELHVHAPESLQKEKQSNVE